MSSTKKSSKLDDARTAQEIYEEMCAKNPNNPFEGYGAYELKEAGLAGYESAPSIIRMGDVHARKVPWMLRPYLALGEVTILEGDPGIGKSLLITAIGTACVDGRKMPNGARAMKGPIAYFTSEDDPEYGIKPRLDGLGCKNQNDFIVCSDSIQWDEQGLAHIRNILQEYQPILVVFDPLTSFLGPNLDMHRANEVAAALGPIKLLAREFDCAIVIVRHLNKDKTRGVMDSGQGSIAFNSVPRLSLRISRVPTRPDMRVISHVKNNLGPDDEALSFYLRQVEGKKREFVWGEMIEGSAYTLVQSDGTIRLSDEGIDSVLEKMFKHHSGVLYTADLRSEMEARGFGWVTVCNHLNKIGAKKGSEKHEMGRNGKHFWTHPSYTPPKA